MWMEGEGEEGCVSYREAGLCALIGVLFPAAPLRQEGDRNRKQNEKEKCCGVV